MTPIEQLKLRLQLTADTTRVRLGQHRDHLIWTHTYQYDDGPFEAREYIHLHEDNDYDVKVTWVSYYNSTKWPSVETFLDAVYKFVNHLPNEGDDDADPSDSY